MIKVLLVFLVMVTSCFPIFLLLIYKTKRSRLTKTKSFSTLINSSEDQENNPDINTNDWYLHKNRLIRFGRSQYKGLTFFVGLEDRIYYLSEEGAKVYC